MTGEASPRPYVRVSPTPAEGNEKLNRGESAMVRRCRACSRHSDDLYEINGWLVCFSCVRTQRFWEMLRESWADEPLVAGPA